MKKQKIKAFTLIELMVVIALIWIIALWISNINFNNLSDRQILDWFFYKIKTNIETIKNNALIWKAIKNWTETFVPKMWRIDFNSDWNWAWTWTIKTYYSKDWIIFNNILNNNISSEKFYGIEIKNFWNILNTANWTWAILIEWNKLSLTWTILPTTDKELEIKVSYKNFDKVFTINTISWVIEEQ